MTDATHDGPDAVALWNQWCETLRAGGEALLGHDGLSADSAEQLDGVRYLTRLVRAGLMAFVENEGPRFPVIRAMPELVKMGLDNPDNVYMSATVDPRFTYRISGTRGTAHYLGFAAQSQNFAKNPELAGGAGHLHDRDLQLGPNGELDVIASVTPHDGNWLALAPDTSMVLVRQSFLDQTTEKPAQLAIECLEPSGPPRGLDNARLAGRLQGSALYALGAAQRFADWVTPWFDHPNEFFLPTPEEHRRIGGDPNIVCVLGAWELADDEALEITLEPPECDYWNIQLGNIWAESLDYRWRHVTYNSHTAPPAAEKSAASPSPGTYVVRIASAPTQGSLWLDRSGLRRGTMLIRWVRAERHPVPSCRIVPM